MVSALDAGHPAPAAPAARRLSLPGWVSAFIVAGALAVNNHGSQDSANFFFRAPAAPSVGVVSLVRVHIQGFDANLNHILDGHSVHADPPSGTHSAQIFP